MNQHTDDFPRPPAEPVPAELRSGATQPRRGPPAARATSPPPPHLAQALLQGDACWAPPVLDAAALRRLFGDDAALRAQFGQHFLAHAGNVAAAIRIAAAQGDCAIGSVLARRLASPAYAVGALALGACCEQLELAFARHAIDTAAELMAHLECQIALAGAWLH
jgi:hypothetical protein